MFLKATVILRKSENIPQPSTCPQLRIPFFRLTIQNYIETNTFRIEKKTTITSFNKDKFGKDLFIKLTLLDMDRLDHVQIGSQHSI